MSDRPANSAPPVDGQAEPSKASNTPVQFDQSVVLQQPPIWSRLILWAILTVSTLSVGWAALAKIESAVSATGKLEPQGTVQEVKVPVNGVVEEVLIRDGQSVEAGDVLLRLDPTVSTAQQLSFNQVKQGLQEENEVFEALLAGQGPGSEWSGNQRSMLQATREDLDSRVSSARLQVSQLERQLDQARVQLSNEKEVLEVNQSILDGIEPLFEEGGLSRIQYLRQKQEVQSSVAEIDRLVQEEARLVFAIDQAREDVINAGSQYRRDLLERLRNNQRQIAEIEGDLTQAMVTGDYEEVRAPISGTIFDLKANRPGTVVSATEPVLKLVPSEAYVARVFITNRDIGFVAPGMEVDVRLDSFPFSEFGDLKGTLASIGSDALPPNELRQFYAFPADIELEDQVFQAKNGREYQLQSGMSVSANIRTRERSILSIFTDQFSRQADGLRTVR